MILDLRPIVSGERDSLDFEAPVDLDLTYTNHDAVGKGSIRTSAGALTLNAECDFKVETVCARCLEPIDRRMRVNVSHYLTENMTEEDSEGYISVNFKSFDVSSLLREDMILSMPSRFLCKPDCLGLCPVCGANLNNGPCEHSESL